MRQMPQKTILITGCSSGIGLYCARALLATSRWRVFAAARKPEDAAKLRAEGFDSPLLDLADATSVSAAAAEVLEKTNGKLDALFNNGAYAIPGAVEDISRDALRTQFETNVFGWLQLTNSIIPSMRQNNGGRIIQNSSVLGYVALKYRGAYNASKYAIEGLTDTMRLELAGSGIRLILIEPGPVRSRFRENATAQYHKWINRDGSIHRDKYLQMETAWQNGKEMVFTLPPDAVWRALRHSLEARSPKLRYRITIPAKVFWYLKRMLPTSALDSILRLAG
ncbi:MAG: SDR family NAD(P)-dependent oxidoreductase [Gammaproteobacteria bacterium]